MTDTPLYILEYQLKQAALAIAGITEAFKQVKESIREYAEAVNEDGEV